MLVVVLTSALLLLPGSSTDVARRWLAHDELTVRSLPPLWFVGLHETLAGSVIDSLPRIRPQRFLVVPERDATGLYRSLWPLYRQLSLIAMAALTAVTIVTFAACAWNSRRLPTPLVRRPRKSLTRIGRGPVAAFDRAWRCSPVVLDLDEEPALPTQRLDLAR